MSCQSNHRASHPHAADAQYSGLLKTAFESAPLVPGVGPLLATGTYVMKTLTALLLLFVLPGLLFAQTKPQPRPKSFEVTAPATPDQKRAIFYDNAVRFFRLSKSARALSEAKGNKAEQEISRVNRDFDEGERQRDFAAIDRTLADDFIWTTFGGTVFDRAETSEHLKSGDSRYELYESDDVRIRIYGDTAVVTARLLRRGRNSKRDLSGEFRYTRVYLKQKGRWRMVAYQMTRIGQQ